MTTTLANPRKRLSTNIEGTLLSALALARAVRSTAETPENTHVVPGWKVIHPSQAEIAEIREVQVLESVPGAAEYPYLLPRDANTTVVVEVGQIEISVADEAIGSLETGQAPYFNPQGVESSIRALSFPTSVLLVSYREREAGATKERH